jgi:hypothetical protein
MIQPEQFVNYSGLKNSKYYEIQPFPKVESLGKVKLSEKNAAAKHSNFYLPFYTIQVNSSGVFSPPHMA